MRTTYLLIIMGIAALSVGSYYTIKGACWLFRGLDEEQCADKYHSRDCHNKQHTKHNVWTIKGIPQPK